MSIQIEIPLDALKRPTVARALSELMLLLGEQTLEPATRIATEPPSPVEPPPAAEECAAPRRRRKGSKPKAAAAGEKWEKFVATKPEPTRRFLTLLKQYGELTVDQAVKTLGLASARAMGGLTGALRRWALKEGFKKLPFDKSFSDGKRVWIWTGKFE